MEHEITTLKRYTLNDGRVVLSEHALTYALDQSGIYILWDKIIPKHIRDLIILPDPIIADIVETVMDGGQWLSGDLAATELDSSAKGHQVPTISLPRNYCIMRGGEIYVRNGLRYIELIERFRQSNSHEQESILYRIAYQALLRRACEVGRTPLVGQEVGSA